MFTQQLSKHLIVTSCFVFGSISDIAFSADYRIELTIQQTPAVGANRRYDVRAVFNGDDVSNLLTAPNGTEFYFRDGRQWVEGLTFQQVAALAFGDWTANTGTSTAIFRFAQFGLGDVDSEVPIITSPVPGSEVPPKFTLNWQSESDGFVDIWNRSNIRFRSIQNPVGCCTANFDIELLGPGKGSFEMDVFTRTFLPDPFVVDKFPSNNDTYTIDAIFRSRSARATFIVVPEPNGLSVAVIAALGLLAESCRFTGRRTRDRSASTLSIAHRRRVAHGPHQKHLGLRRRPRDDKSLLGFYAVTRGHWQLW